MRLFNRKNTETVLPPEVNQYYASQRRERAGMMAIFGFSALIITILVGLALFFGGRALYRNIYADKNDSNDTAQTELGDNSPSGLSISGSSNGSDSSNVNRSTSSLTASSGSSNTTSSAPATTQTNSTTSGSQQTAANNSSMPNTGDAPTPTELPKTGDEGM